MMIRSEVYEEPHFVEIQGREVLEIRSLGRNMQAYRIFRAHSTDDKEKENVKIEKRRGPPLRSTLGRKDAVQDRKFSPSYGQSTSGNW